MSKEAIEKIVADYFAAIRAMNADAWVATFAEDGISHDPVGNPPMRGHAELRRFLEGIAGAFNTVGLTENHVFVSGDGAAVKWTGRGVGRNGREVTFEGIDVFQVNAHGKIQTVWAYWDAAALMAQLQGQ
ncbi:MAG: nuclear transport factor 2 family protein [Acidobacteria bacterium]|nr:nuclear transport factor 2 family protein [Acidobacteriota bacterium]